MNYYNKSIKNVKRRILKNIFFNLITSVLQNGFQNKDVQKNVLRYFLHCCHLFENVTLTELVSWINKKI